MLTSALLSTSRRDDLTDLTKRFACFNFQARSLQQQQQQQQGV